MRTTRKKTKQGKIYENILSGDLRETIEKKCRHINERYF